MEWTSHNALTDQYEDILDACAAGFALSQQPGQRHFWGRVKDRAEKSVGADLPWQELDDDSPGLEENVLDRADSSKTTDPANIRRVVELVADGEFGVAKKRDRHRLQHTYKGYTVQQPKTIPDTSKENRESALAKQSHGEVQHAGELWKLASVKDPAPAEEIEEDVEGSEHLQPFSVSGIDDALDGGDLQKRKRFLSRLNPWAKDEDGSIVEQKLSSAELVAALRQRSSDAATRLTLGVEREILTEDGKVRRWCRFLDPRALAAQWVLLHGESIEGTGDKTIRLAMNPWLDGTTIGGHACVGGTITFRPVDCAVADDQHKRPRVSMYAEDTRETREVYELLVRIMSVQMFAACESELKVTVGDRTFTIQLEVNAVQGDYHAQQAWNGMYMSGRWRCPFAFVPQEKYGNFASWCDQIETKIARGAGVAVESLTPAQIKTNIKLGLNRLQDYYEIAAVLKEARRDQEDGSTTYDEVDLSYCRVGGSDSMVHGIAPWAVNLRHTGADSRPLALERHGVKCSNLAPAPEHSLMVTASLPRSTTALSQRCCRQAITKNCFYEFERKLPRDGRAVAHLKAKVKQYCQRDSYDQYMVRAAAHDHPPEHSAHACMRRTVPTGVSFSSLLRISSCPRLRWRGAPYQRRSCCSRCSATSASSAQRAAPT